MTHPTARTVEVTEKELFKCILSVDRHASVSTSTARRMARAILAYIAEGVK